MIRSVEVSALFVQTGGHYFGLDGVDPWDAARDARTYSGPYPVVAHPPCNLWVSFAFVNFKRYGGEHNRPGNDGGCFASALTSVRQYGGVLEHPAFSHAWKTHGLRAPTGKGWTSCGHGEWTCEIWQSAYGHRARKRTWLFYKGANNPAEMKWERQPAAFQIGYHDQRGPARNKPTVGKKEASRTPIELRDALIALARNVGCIHDWREMPWQEAYPASSGRVCRRCDKVQLGWLDCGINAVLA